MIEIYNNTQNGNDTYNIPARSGSARRLFPARADISIASRSDSKSSDEYFLSEAKEAGAQKIVFKPSKEAYPYNAVSRWPQGSNWLRVLPEDILTKIYRKSLNSEINSVHPQNLIKRYKNYLKKEQNNRCEIMVVNAMQYLIPYGQFTYVSSNEILFTFLRITSLAPLFYWWKYESNDESRTLFYISLVIKLSEYDNIEPKILQRTLKLLKNALSDNNCWFSQDMNKKLCGSETYIGYGLHQIQDVCNCIWKNLFLMSVAVQ